MGIGKEFLNLGYSKKGEPGICSAEILKRSQKKVVVSQISYCEMLDKNGHGALEIGEKLKITFFPLLPASSPGSIPILLKSFPSPPAPLPSLGEGRHNSSSPSPKDGRRG